MPNAQKITNVYKSVYLQNRLSPPPRHLFDKYDVGPEPTAQDETDSKSLKYFETILKDALKRNPAKQRKIE